MSIFFFLVFLFFCRWMGRMGSLGICDWGGGFVLNLRRYWSLVPAYLPRLGNGVLSKDCGGGQS